MLFQKYEKKSGIATEANYKVVPLGILRIFDTIPFLFRIVVDAYRFKHTYPICPIIIPINPTEIKTKNWIRKIHKSLKMKKTSRELPAGQIQTGAISCVVSNDQPYVSIPMTICKSK